MEKKERFDWRPFVNALRDLYEERLPRDTIRAELSRLCGRELTLGAVNMAIERYCPEEREARGILHRQEIQVTNESMVELARAGLSPAEIARKLGVDRDRVYGNVSKEDRGDRRRDLADVFPDWIYSYPLDTEVEPLAIGGLSLVELERSSCRWAIGRGADGNHRFCGCKKVDRTSYCSAHLAQSRASFDEDWEGREDAQRLKLLDRIPDDPGLAARVEARVAKRQWSDGPLLSEEAA